MTRTAPFGLWSQARARARTGLDRWLAAGLLLIGLTVSTAAFADPDPVRGEATLTVANGFARLILKFSDDVTTDVSTAGSILLVHFDRPTNVPVDRWLSNAPDYISGARGDPDGSALRLSLSRKVRVNTMSAGERVFIDLLPDSWTGAPPNLPQDVVKELAERARSAERALRAQRADNDSKKRPPIRVRALVQPTFVRFVFEMPDGVGISSVLTDQKVTLQFNAPLTFDLADAKLAAPPNIASINQKTSAASSTIELAMIGEVDVHPFREDKTYNIDVAFLQGDKPKTVTLPSVEAAPAAKPTAEEQPKAEQSKAAPHAGEIVPPTSDSIAREMKSEGKPEVKSEAKSEDKAEAKADPVAPTAAPAVRMAAAPDVKEPAAVKFEMPKSETPKSETPRSETSKSEMSMGEAPKVEIAKAEMAKADAAKTDIAKAEPAKADMGEPEAAKPGIAKAAVPLPEPAKPQAAAPPVVKASAAANSGAQDRAGAVDAFRDSDGLRLTFGFAQPTPAALFRRGDTVWLLFDSTKPLNVEPIRAKGGAIVGEVSVLPLEKGQAVRIRLNQPQMHSLSSDDGAGKNWTLAFADKVLNTPQPLNLMRNVNDPALANVAVPFANPGPGLLHRLIDPDAGDTLLVVTALPPIRGFIKRQDFVDMSFLDSIHGIAIRPNSDSVTVELAPDGVSVGKPGGLTLSSVGYAAAGRAASAVQPIFDPDQWTQNRSQPFLDRMRSLSDAVATAEPEQRAQARLALARFYMANGMYQESKGVTNLMMSDGDPRTDETAMLMVHAVSSILTGRPDQGLKDIASPAIGTNFDAQMWKGLAYARQGKWPEAREKLKNVEFAIAALPLDMQRIVTTDAMRASLEIKDFAGAAKRRSELEVIGVPAEMKPQIAVLRGRLAEAMGQEKDALDEYRLAIASDDRQAAAEGKLLETKLKQKRNEITPEDATRELETLQAIWRGDTIELKTLQALAQLYSDAGRYADSLMAARTATRLMPNSDEARQAQDSSAALFSQLFLDGKADNMQPIDALGTFYDFRELTPIGRRGDEMIRKLADRLAGVDLLDQAAELLQYQIDKRLEGAARAQVAARLAMVYLTNRKPDRAIAALRTTRIADLAGELRQQRLLLEARAQSDIGRHDLGLDIISNVGGREAIRLRSDIYWASRRWREASEQIELYYGDRWRDFRPLNPAERGDVLRAVVGYSLAEDAIGLARFREKYAPLMTGEADKIAFDVASKPASGSAAEFTQIAKMAASVDTMDGFLRDMKARFPDATGRAPDKEAAARDAGLSEATGSLPQIKGIREADATR